MSREPWKCLPVCRGSSGVNQTPFHLPSWGRGPRGLAFSLPLQPEGLALERRAGHRKGVFAEQTNQEEMGGLAEVILLSREGTGWGRGEWAEVPASTSPLTLLLTTGQLGCAGKGGSWRETCE